MVVRFALLAALAWLAAPAGTAEAQYVINNGYAGYAPGFGAGYRGYGNNSYGYGYGYNAGYARPPMVANNMGGLMNTIVTQTGPRGSWRVGPNSGYGYGYMPRRRFR